MAGQVYNLSDPEVVNTWEERVELETRYLDALLDPDNGLAGEDGSNSIVTQKDQLTDGPGAFIRMKMGYQLEGRGRAGDEPLKSHAEAYKTATFDVYVNTIRHAFSSASPITQQWVTEDVLDTGNKLLGDWMAQRLSLGLHAHATGFSLLTDDAYRLHNTINAVNSEYIIRPNSKAAGDLTASDTFDIDLLNDAAAFVKSVSPQIRPAMTKWGPKYCVFISPFQARDLRKSDTVWFSKMTAMAQGGGFEENGLYTRLLGGEQDFLIFVSNFIPPGLDSDSSPTQGVDKTSRAWIGGAGALSLAWGRGYRVAPGYNLNRFAWARESEDFSHQHDIACTTIVGAARPRFTKPGESSAREQGIVVVETYADRGSIGLDNAYRLWINAGVSVS